MEGFTYTNIFDTKGIEYLVVIAFLILVIPFWRALNRPLKVKEAIGETLGILNAAVLRIPQGLFYSKNHVWTHLERSGKVSLGLDDMLMRITGRVELKNFRKPGEKISKGDLIAEITQDGKLLKIASPISGEIRDVNELVSSEPDVLNEDPYGKGWLYKIKPEKWTDETADSVVANDARKWSENELLKFKDFVAHSLQRHYPETSMVVLQEGGELADHPLAGMPEEVWQDFEENFLRV